MTKEEAITILQESKRQEKCMIDNYTTFFTTKNATDGVQNARRRYIALDMAISEMRKPVKLDRNLWDGCEYCRKSCANCAEMGKRACCHSVIGDYECYVQGGKNYCSYCGRPLTEEAWEQLEQRIGGNDGKIDKKG